MAVRTDVDSSPKPPIILSAAAPPSSLPASPRLNLLVSFIPSLISSCIFFASLFLFLSRTAAVSAVQGPPRDTSSSNPCQTPITILSVFNSGCIAAAVEGPRLSPRRERIYDRELHCKAAVCTFYCFLVLASRLDADNSHAVFTVESLKSSARPRRDHKKIVSLVSLL